MNRDRCVEKWERWSSIRTSPASMAARLSVACSFALSCPQLCSSCLSLLRLDLEGGGDIEVRRDVGGVLSLVGVMLEH